jgi:hypothetical protein|tara:strand:- start:363 stop:821 length:459 start_codon:yes stop_codon:yes gene_type:complete
MTNKNKKVYYSIIDVAAQPRLTLRMQHVLNHDMAHRLNGEIAYYATEDPETTASQKITKSMLHENLQVDGFIFLQMRQFCYGPTFNFKLLKEFIENGYEVYFTREAVSILDMDDLEQKKELLYIFFKTYGEDRNDPFLKSFVRAAASSPIAP